MKVERTNEIFGGFSDDDYPALGINTAGVIFLFLREGEGTVVAEPEHRTVWQLGEFWDDLDMNEFRKFSGVIHLSND